MRMTLLNAGLTAACLVAGLGVTVTDAFADDDRTFSVVSRADDDAEGGYRVLHVRVDSDGEPDQDSRRSATTKPSAAVTPAATTNSVPSTANATTKTPAPSATANASPTRGSTNAGSNGAAQASASAAPVGAVPEPETYAMMALGVVLMGFVARRRKG